MSRTIDINNSLSVDEACHFADSKTLIELGEMANAMNIDMNGPDCIYHEYVYIAISSYGKLSKEAWVHKHLEKAESLVKDSSSEIKFSYASHKKVVFSIEKLLLLTRALSTKYPQVEISPIDIFQIHNIKLKERISIRETLQMFFDAGARILDGRHPTHLSISECLEFHKIAHNIGYRSHLFLVYRPYQDLKLWFDFLDRVKTIQSQYEGFLSFTPMPLKHFQSNFDKSNILHDLKMMSLSRLFLNNISHIQVPISRHGISLSQIALAFGANAIRGRISDTPNSRFVRCNELKTINRAEITSLISKAQREAKESNAFFQYNMDYSEASKYTESVKSVSMLLYKHQHNESLTNDEFEILAHKCPLILLGQSAKKVRTVSDKENPVWILSDKKLSSELDSAFFGVTELLEGNISDNITARISSQCSIVIPDHKDKVGILTNTEIENIHTSLSEKDFDSLGKLELTAPFHGDGEPFGSYLLRN